MNLKEQLAEEAKLLAAIIEQMPQLDALWQQVDAPIGYEHHVSRFYDQSFKVFRLQEYTDDIVKALRNLAPQRPLHPWFAQIVAEGTGKEFTLDANDRWLETTRPIVEAFFHARYFLEMVCKYGKELKEPPKPLRPGGWGAVLDLYGLQ